MTIMLSFGKYSGFYLFWEYSFRICLGWVAFTIIPTDVDLLLAQVFNIHEETK